MERCRVAVIEIVLNGRAVTANLVVYECSRAAELTLYLTAPPPEAAPQPVLRRIFLAEWSAGSRDLRPAKDGSIREVFDTQLHVPSDLFHEHASHGVGSCFEPREEQIINSYLITALSAEQRWCVGLFDLWEYTGPTEDLMCPCPVTQRLLCPGDAGLTLMCEDTERQLQFHQWSSRPGWLVVAPRKCSYWSRKRDDGTDGWDVVILCDPPSNTAKVLGLEGRRSILLNPGHPFLGGYHEFLPRDIAAKGTLSLVTIQILGGEEDELEERGGHDEITFRGVRGVGGLDDAVLADGMNMENGDIVELADGVGVMAEGAPVEVRLENERKRSILAALKNTVSPRTSLFDDLRYYFCRHSRVFSLPEDHPEEQGPQLAPSTITLFPLKLIASHYSLLHAFVSFQTAFMRSTGWALRRETPQQMEEANLVETSWSRFRCSEYLEALETLLDSLGITLYGLEGTPGPPRETTPLLLSGSPTIPTTSEPSWRSAIAPDFLFLHRQFTMRRHDYDRITTSIAALAGIISGRVAVSEAKAAKSLTYVAMLFAPLAWVAAVYSIPNDVGPGGRFFWKYWATAIPFMLLVWFLMTAWHHRRTVARNVDMVRMRRGNAQRGRRIEDMV